MEKIFITLFYFVAIATFMWKFGRAAFFSKEKFKKYVEPNVKSARKIDPQYQPNYTSLRMTYILMFVGSLIISLIILWFVFIMWT